MLRKREQIKVMVTKYSLTYVWLCRQLNKLGFELTPAELCLYVTGRRRNANAEGILDASLLILDLYEKNFEEKEKSPD